MNTAEDSSLSRPFRPEERWCVVLLCVQMLTFEPMPKSRVWCGMRVLICCVDSWSFPPTDMSGPWYRRAAHTTENIVYRPIMPVKRARMRSITHMGRISHRRRELFTNSNLMNDKIELGNFGSYSDGEDVVVFYVTVD